jgi:hypothetical protein
MRELLRGEEFYDGTALLGDPVHGYISFTTPRPSVAERTEKDLIDTAWMQRLRQIYQLQSARWVYPSAEHSRFQHSLGAMHLAGRFARHLYPSLRAAVPDCHRRTISKSSCAWQRSCTTSATVPSAIFSTTTISNSSS